MATPDWDAMILVGRIIRPHGNRGNVVVHPETDYGEQRFSPGSRLRWERDGVIAEAVVTESREHDGRWVVGFEGVTTIDGAEGLRGLELRIPEDAMLPAGEGRFYLHDLVGCRVKTTTGREAGIVERVELATGIPQLELNGPNGEVLIPFTEAICTRIDIAAREIEIDPPEGLLEVNERKPAKERIARGGEDGASNDR